MVAESWGVGVGVAIVLGAWLGWPALLIVACGVLILQALRVHWNLLFIVIMAGTIINLRYVKSSVEYST